MRYLYFILIFIAFLNCIQAEKVDPKEPFWKELSSLIGKHRDSKDIKEFAQKHNLKEYSKGHSGGFSNYGKSSFSLLFQSNIISSVVISVSNPPNYSNPVFKEKLPYNLKQKDLPKDVLKKLGKPSHHPYREYMNYDSLGITVSFWKNKNTGISEIKLRSPKKKITKP